MISISQMLPPLARRKYASFHAAVEDTRAALAALADRVRRAEEAVHYAQHNLTVTDPKNRREADRLLREFEAATADLAALEADRAIRLQRLRDAESMISPIESWFARFDIGPQPVGECFTDVPPAVDAAATLAGETIADAVARVRGELTKQRSALMRLRGAPLPAAEIKRQIIAEIDRMMRKPGVHLDGGKVRIDWPDVSQYAHHPGNGSVTGMLTWLMRDHLVALMTSGIDAAVGDTGIPLEDRGPREAVLLAQILACEREEEALVSLAAAAGRPIARRRDADPMAILGIAWPTPEVQPAPALAAAE